MSGDPLFHRIGAFVRGLNELGYDAADQVKALAAQISVILLTMTPAERDLALSVHLLVLADMFADRQLQQQLTEVVAANVRSLDMRRLPH